MSVFEQLNFDKWHKNCSIFYNQRIFIRMDFSIERDLNGFIYEIQRQFLLFDFNEFKLIAIFIGKANKNQIKFN